MINKYLILFSVLSTLACSQKQNNKVNNDKKNMNTMVTGINETIDTFKSRPYYQINVKSSGVNFDIRVNDVPVFRFFGESGGTNMEYPINTAILESGKQILNVKVYPIKGKQLILPNNVFTLELNKKEDAWVFDNKREIILAVPKMVVPEKGLPYWEFSTEFNADVPYKLNGWRNSKRIDDLSDIEKKLEVAYSKIQKTIEEKNNKEFRKLTEGKISEEAISLYEKEKGGMNGFQEEKETILPFHNCQIKFYGNGRLVRLEDEEGESCFKGKTMENDKPVEYSYPILFHMPQNSDELEVIR